MPLSAHGNWVGAVPGRPPPCQILGALTPAPLPPGAWAAYSTRCPRAARSSPAPPWRSNCTSSSASLVRGGAQRGLLGCSGGAVLQGAWSEGAMLQGVSCCGRGGACVAESWGAVLWNRILGDPPVSEQTVARARRCPSFLLPGADPGAFSVPVRFLQRFLPGSGSCPPTLQPAVTVSQPGTQKVY